MKKPKIPSMLMVGWMAFSVAGAAHASMTERLEAKYLKSRVKMRIDEDWKVQSGNASGAEATAFNDASWATTNVPHDFSITLVKPTLNDPGASGWYRKHFTLPAGFAGKKVIVQFDGVYHDSKVYLNGTQVGGQQYGYVSFYCDLTPYLNATGDNVLAVFVDNVTVRNSRWYSGTGIFRHVWLIATDKVYVRNWGTAVTTPTVAVAQSQISVQTDVVNELATDQTRTLETAIYDEVGSELVKTSTPITVTANSTGTYTQSLTLSSCKLWSTSTPVRYYAYSRLLSNASPADDYVTPFGIREIKYTPGTGLTINGVSTKMKGVCLHHTLVPAGAAVADGMWERAIKELKASGANSIRTSHNPYSQEFYDLCDQLGMLVMDEFADKWSQPAGGVSYENWDANWQKDVTSFVERDRNHPSIVMWSMGNEVYYGGTIPPYITTVMGQLVPFVHALDKGSSRPVLHACNVQDAAGYVNLAKIQDNFAGLNYGDSIYSKIHQLDPNVLIMGTENDPYTIPGSLMPTWFSVKDSPYVVGHHIWTAWDYLGENPPLGSAYGYLDNCMFRKSYFYYQLSQWSDAPMVHVTVGNGSGSGRTMPPLAEDWNQSGSVDVTTYTNCDSVDLYVNSTKIGTKNLSDFPNMIMVWPSVPWSTGTIKAVGMKGGVQVAVDSINTASAAAKVVLKPDKTTLYADGEDVSNIEVSLADAADNFIFAATDTVQFTLTGAGRSLGIASGDWSSSEPFKATSRKLYHGKVLIVIQSTMTPGTIGLTVTVGTLPPATLTITTGAASGTGGNAGAGGTSGSGGAIGGGGSGGITMGGGGIIATGGTMGGGGANGTGGRVSSGGVMGGGGANVGGGTTSTGGVSVSGGAGGTIGGSGGSSLGGATSNGGAGNMGGTNGRGGANDAGGTISQGGVTGSGGTNTSGGIMGTGGRTASNQGGSTVRTGQSGTKSSGCSCMIDKPGNEHGTGLLLLGAFVAAAAMNRRRRKRVSESLCGSSAPPACGCDGVTYPSECARIAANVVLAHSGACSEGGGIQDAGSRE
jgi:beta-galactosidase